MKNMDAEDKMLVQEILENIRDDVTGINQEIQMIDPAIEKEIFFEDLLDKDRLNADIDIEDDARIRSILDTIVTSDASKYTKGIDREYIRNIRDSELNIRMHLDGGANRSVTDDLRLLNNIRTIPEYNMFGAQKGEATIRCTKVGYMKLMCRGRGVVNVKTFYSPDISETILSPGDITKSPENNFSLWDQHCNHDTGRGYIRFSARSGLQHATVDTKLMNGLWYATQSLLDCVHPDYQDWNNTPESITPILRRLSKAALHELWHQRLCHPGETVTNTIARTSEGVPNLSHGRNEFYKCETCMRAKMRKSSKSHLHSTTQNSTVRGPGQMFHMDFGFVRGSDFKNKESDGKIITSRDGYNSYLIIVDKYSSYTWIMLSRSKDPPVQFVESFLAMHRDKSCAIAKVRTDQGGELWASSDFQKVIRESTCLLEPTGAGDPAQNGKAEAPNKTFGNMMRGMLFNANLGSEYWSYALVHAVYVKNRLPHSALSMRRSPYEAYTGIKPNLSLLRVWGCRVIVKNPQMKKAKLDDNTSKGIFLRYTATDKNIVYLDLKTNQEKIASHVIFDEAHFSTGSKAPGAQALKTSGIDTRDEDAGSTSIKVKQLHQKATLPTRATVNSAGLDLYAPEQIVIKAKSMKMIPVGIAMSIPKGMYGRLAPRSGLTVKREIDVKAGVVDNDFRGEITVVLKNMGDKDQEFNVGDKIAQLILEKYDDSQPVEWTMELDKTEREQNGFGSSDANIRQLHSRDHENIILSDNPYGPTTVIECKVRGNDEMLGMEVDDKSMVGRLILMHCKKGTPMARIPKWRTQLRGAILVKIDDVQVSSIEEIIRTIQNRKLKLENLKPKDRVVHLTFRTLEKTSMHPQKGIPQLYYDQLNVIAQHQFELKEKGEVIVESNGEISHEWCAKVRQLNDENIEETLQQKDAKVVEKLTRRILMKRDDWDEWRDSEAKQLNQYEQQGMFSEPQPRPDKANILNLLWTYLIKAEGTKKARCCCNGNPGRQGSITLAHTYAACVEQPAQRVYWGLTAIKGFIAIGADASNAFAEAPPPKAPLFVLVDRQYREWYKSKYNKDIPKGYVLRVKHAIQGHPEAPRLWSEFIDEIIQSKLNLTPTTHEKCLYRGHMDGKEVLFLRQVDDFSVAAEDEATCNKVIQEISKHLKAPLKNLGRVTRFNGVEVDQTNKFVRLHNTQYIEKILKRHGWLNDNYKSSRHPVPMRSDSKYLHLLENAKGPTDDKDRQKLELKMGFNYRQALGEILYAMVTCRPDISVSTTKLSQYSQNPAEEHYVALKNIFRYLRYTKKDGLIYWRKRETKFENMKSGETPVMYSDNEIIKELMEDSLNINNESNMFSFVDSDWAGDTVHRKSITGIAVMFAGSVIAYKSKIQRTIALSSTEAEFMAACEAGKTILYLRTILEEMGVEQTEATILFEDNQGALLMANAQQPTRRTRHLDTAAFALQDWVSRDLVCLTYVSTTLNSSDAMTKPLARILFYKHFDRLMGRIDPNHIRSAIKIEKKGQTKLDHTTMTTENVMFNKQSNKFDNVQNMGGVL